MTRAAIVAVALVAIVWALLHVGFFGRGQITDYAVYEKYGAKIVHHHQVPYRDFKLEYPPGALPIFALPTLLGRFGYHNVFQGMMAVCAAAAALGTLLAGGRRAAYLAAIAPLALGSVVLSRFDFWPTALTVLGLAAALRRRPVLSGVLMGTAFAAKLWPGLLAPLLVVWLVRTHGARAARRWAIAAGATALAWFLPFVILSPSGVAHSFHEQYARPLQLESLGSTILIAAHYVTNSTIGVTTDFGSQNLGGTGVHAMMIATSVVEVIALLVLYIAFVRGETTSDDLIDYSVAVVAVAIVFGKVFSPQFLIWLIPLVALVRGARATVAVPIFFAALVLTQAYFPRRYWQLATELRRLIAMEVLLRDLLVVALVLVVVWPVRRAARARSPLLEPVRPR